MKVTINKIKISGISACVPRQQRFFSDTPETVRITRSTGIHSVRIVEASQDAETLAVAAAANLLEKLNINQEELGALVWVSQSPSKPMPYGAARLARALGLSTHAAVLDIASGCAGYIQGILQGALMIQAGAASKVLVLAAEANSRIIHPDDASLAMLFGDAGTATLLEQGTESMGFEMHHDGSGDAFLTTNAQGLLTMDGMEVFQFSIQRVPELLKSLCETHGLSIKQVPLFAMHQANAFILQYIAKKMKLSEEQMPFLADGFGNTGPASIPLLLCVLSEQQRLPNQIVMAGFGIGLQWGGAIASMADAQVLPVQII